MTLESKSLSVSEMTLEEAEYIAHPSLAQKSRSNPARTEADFMQMKKTKRTKDIASALWKSNNPSSHMAAAAAANQASTRAVTPHRCHAVKKKKLFSGHRYEYSNRYRN